LTKGACGDNISMHLFQKGVIFLGRKTMANTSRAKIILACTECKERNYATTKNKKNDPERKELVKFCKRCNKHTIHKETK